MKNGIYRQCLVLLLANNLAVHAGTNTSIIQSPDGKGYVVQLPFDVAVIETAAAKELNTITNKAATLLMADDYDKLDELFTTLRSSKMRWANGQWKLASAYAGLVPSGAPEMDWKVQLASLRDWRFARPASINARTALAYFLVDYAWKARGSGWANTVTDGGWRLFAGRLNEANKVLSEAKGTADQCPVSWSVLMKSGLGLNIKKPDFDAIFDKAIHFAPDYEAYYFPRATYLLPRWHGDEGEWESDLAKSADRIGGDKGDEVYARVVWCMHGVFTNIFKENKLSWTRVDKGFEIIEKDFPDSLAAKNAGAHLAVLARDPEKARKYFAQTEGKVDLSEWKSKLEYIRFATWAYNH